MHITMCLIIIFFVENVCCVQESSEEIYEKFCSANLTAGYERNMLKLS
jgi:hypothetical protein